MRESGSSWSGIRAETALAPISSGQEIILPDILWPTPRVGGLCGGSGSLALMRRLESRGVISKMELRGMTAGNGGKLNPEWAEWLLGLPIGWTDCEG